MKFRYVIEVEVARTEGKFAPRDEISEEISMNGFSDPGSLSVGDSSYDVTSFEVSEEPESDPLDVVASRNSLTKRELRAAITKAKQAKAQRLRDAGESPT